jgi:hypothetical protein
MPMFRKKPVVIEAVQFLGFDHPPGGAAPKNAWPPEWPSGMWRCTLDANQYAENLVIPTLEGDHTALPGDWIIKGVNGEFYPCKPDIFAKTYEPAE